MDDSRPYRYNTTYENMLGRWGTASERKDLQNLAYAEAGNWTNEKTSLYLDRVREGLRTIIGMLDNRLLSHNQRDQMVEDAVSIQSAEQAYALLDQLDEMDSPGPLIE